MSSTAMPEAYSSGAIMCIASRGVVLVRSRLATNKGSSMRHRFLCVTNDNYSAADEAEVDYTSGFSVFSVFSHVR